MDNKTAYVNEPDSPSDNVALWLSPLKDTLFIAFKEELNGIPLVMLKKE